MHPFLATFLVYFTVGFIGGAIGLAWWQIAIMVLIVLIGEAVIEIAQEHYDRY